MADPTLQELEAGDRLATESEFINAAKLSKAEQGDRLATDKDMRREAVRYTLEDLARARMGLKTLEHPDVEASNWPGTMAWAAGLGGSTRSAIYRLLGQDDAADYFQMLAQAYRTAANQADEKRWQKGETVIPPIVSRGFRGAAESLPPMVIAGQAGGPFAALGTAGAMEADRSITRGRLAGKKGADLAGYAATQGIIEAGVGAIFQKLGFGGVETMAAGRQVAAKGLGDALKRVGISTAQEIPEEILTEISHNVVDALEKVDPNATSLEAIQQTILDTTVQTIIGSAMMGGPGVVQGAAIGKQRAERLKQLKEIREKGFVTESDAKKAGIEGESRKERLANTVAEIHEIEQELQNAEQVQAQEQEPVERETEVQQQPEEQAEEVRIEATTEFDGKTPAEVEAIWREEVPGAPTIAPGKTQMAREIMEVRQQAEAESIEGEDTGGTVETTKFDLEETEEAGQTQDRHHGVPPGAVEIGYVKGGTEPGGRVKAETVYQTEDGRHWVRESGTDLYRVIADPGDGMIPADQVEGAGDASEIFSQRRTEKPQSFRERWSDLEQQAALAWSQGNRELAEALEQQRQSVEGEIIKESRRQVAETDLDDIHKKRIANEVAMEVLRSEKSIEEIVDDKVAEFHAEAKRLQAEAEQRQQEKSLRESIPEPKGLSFHSGLTRSPKDLADSIADGRPVGVSAFSGLSATVRKQLVDYANNGGNIFIDSGAFTAFTKGKEVEWDKVFFTYHEMISSVNEEQRSNVYIVAPDVVGNHKSTFKLQQDLEEEFGMFLESGATVIFPVQRGGHHNIASNFADLTDTYGELMENVVIGVPFNAKAWSQDAVMDLLRFRQSDNFMQPIHLLGGGESKLRSLFEAAQAEGLSVEGITGDALPKSISQRRKPPKKTEPEQQAEPELSDIDKAMAEALEKEFGKPKPKDRTTAGQKALEARAPRKKSKAKKATESRKERTAKELDDALKEFKDIFREDTLPAGLDANKVAAAVKLTKAAINHGISTFADFTVFVAENVGEATTRAIHPYIESAWKMLGRMEDFSHIDPVGKVSEVLDEKAKSKSAGDEGVSTPTEPSAEDVRGAEEDTGAGSVLPGRSESVPGDAGQTDQPGSKRVRSSKRSDKSPHHSRPRIDYRLTGKESIEAGGVKTKFKNNIAALRLLKQLEDENRRATAEEQAILVKWVGWGGMPQAFDSKNAKWKREYAELKELMTPEEYAAARKSTRNAHYTSPEVVSAMWDSLIELGFKGGRVTEPGMGTGLFFGLMPEEMRSNSQLSGVEMDSVTGRIARQLYQTADISIQPFQKVRMDDDSVDLFISNVPFAKGAVNDNIDRDLGRENLSIHDYYFAKAMKKTRPGGLVAFITSRFTADKKDSGVRRLIESLGGNFVGAVRLPNNAFKGIANTDVVTDILIYQKRAEGQESTSQPFIKTVEVPVGDETTRINEYYAENPENILGELALEGTLYAAGEQTVKPDGRDLGASVRDKLKDIPVDRDALDRVAKVTKERLVPEYSAPTADLSDGNLTVTEDGLFQQQGDRLVPIEVRKNTETVLKRIGEMTKVRAAARKLLNAQVTPGSTDADLKALRDTLNQEYDAFVDSYGYFSTTYNTSILSDDIDFPMLRSLENWDSETKTATKADVFRKRTQQPVEEPVAVNDPNEALIQSLAWRGRVDTDYIKSLLGTEDDAVLSQLEGEIYRTPGGEWVHKSVYLSGNVRRKLAAAEAAGLDANAEALRKVLPADKEPGDVSVKLGASWVPTEVYSQFIDELIGREVNLKYVRSEGTWVLDYDVQRMGSRETGEWGTDRMGALELIKKTMNFRQIRVMDKDSDGNSFVNTEETAAANAKAQAIKDEFARWIFSDPTRAVELMKLYNETQNNTVPMNAEGAHLKFPGMASTIQLRPHQKNAVWRILSTGNTLLGHVVGAGKTWTMVAAAMEMRRLNLAKKPVIVVPNHLIDQWPTEFMQLYPGAKVLAAGSKDFQKGRRMRLMNKIRTGDWDAVIIPMSSFEKIPMSKERQDALYQKQIDDLTEEIHAAKAERGTDNRNYVKELENAKEKLQNKLEKLGADWKKDAGPFFDELGIDALFVDEAHEFKNLFYRTKMARVAGAGSTDAQKTFDMHQKTEYLNEKTNNRNIVFATGTAISNSVSEVFTMQRYLQPQTLEERGVGSFDAWAAAFGEIVTEPEVSPDGRSFRMHSRFADFSNVDILQQIFSQVMDAQTQSMLKLPVPKVKGGKPESVQAPESPELKSIVSRLVKRAEQIKRGNVDPKDDNMLNITTDGRKVATDLRLIDPGMPDLPDSKVNMAVDNIVQIHQQRAANSDTQIVWLDMGTPNSTGVDLYNDMKQKLISRGVAPEEIAFLHDANTDAKKKILTQKVRKGTVRILFASSKKGGTGLNVQERLYAAHHIDPPWRPADIEQRDGRIIRQGNQHEAEGVEIFRYVTKGSFDAYMWQTLERKAKFITNFLEGNGTNEKGDIGEVVLSFAEVKALASGNPKMMDYTKLQSDVAQLSAEEQSHIKAQYRAQTELMGIPERKKVAADQAEARRQVADEYNRIKESLGPDETVDVVIDGQRYVKPSEAGEALRTIMEDQFPVDERGSWKTDSLSVTVFGQSYTLRFHVRDGKMRGAASSKNSRWVELGDSPEGNITRLINAVKGAEEQIEAFELEQENLDARAERLQVKADEAFPKSEELANKRAEMVQLEAELKEPEKTDDDEGKAPTGDAMATVSKGDVFESARKEPAKAPAPAQHIEDLDREQKGRIKEVTEDMVQMISPAHVTDVTRSAAHLFREEMARAAQWDEASREALRAMEGTFNRMSPEDSYEFIDRLEAGEAQATRELDKIAEAIRTELDKGRDRLQKLGKLREFYENYFPHLWKDAKQAGDKIRSISATKSWRSSGFLKKRTHITHKEGRDAGLEPLSDNPIENALQRLHQVNKYVARTNMLEKLKRTGMLKFVPAVLGKDYTPAGFLHFDDPAFVVKADPTITVSEAYDRLLADQLSAVLSRLGVNHRRVANLAGGKLGEAGPGGIRTKFATPLSVLAHELGHQIGYIYGLFDYLTKGEAVQGKKFKSGTKAGKENQADARRKRVAMQKELRALADLRIEQQPDVSATHKKYIRKRAEKEAVILEAWLAAPDKMEKVAPSVTAAWKQFLEANEAVRPLLDLDRSVVLAQGTQEFKMAGELTLGRWAMPEDVANLVKNMLSPGLRGSPNIVARGLYNGARFLGNAMNQASLSLSGFHALNVLTDATATQIGLAIQQVERGQFGRAVWNLATSPAAGVAGVIQGGQLIKAMRSDIEALSPEMQEFVRTSLAAGGRASMDPIYHNYAIRQISKSIRDVRYGTVGKKVTGAAKLPFQLIFGGLEMTAKPIMEWMVPRMKLAAFYKLSQDVYDRAGKENLSDFEINEQLTQTWDSVDNRLGQLAYDNLFWNQYVKDASMLAVRSVGWNLGSIREFGGAFTDVAGTKGRLSRGDQLISRKMGYAIGAVLTYAPLGMLLMYAMTGELPEELKDYFFPKTGRKNRDGSPERISLPTYAKDWIAWSTQPGETAKHKLHPLLGTVADQVTNKDYYGTKIRNEDDPMMTQLIDSVTHVGKAFVPFSLKNMGRFIEAGEDPRLAVPMAFSGITSAPAYIARSPAEKLAYDLMVDNIPQGSRTKEQVEASRKRKDIVQRLRRGETVTPDEIKQYSRRQMQLIQSEAKKTGFEVVVGRLHIDQAMKVWKLASDKEKGQIRELLQRRLINKAAVTGASRNEKEEARKAQLHLGQLGITTHEQAQKVLVDSRRRPDGRGKRQTEYNARNPRRLDPSYVKSALALAELYGESNPKEAVKRFRKSLKASQ